MKRFLFVFAGLLWAVSLASPARIVAADSANPVVDSQGSLVKTNTDTDVATPEGKVTGNKSEYTLPYPGILPDHPLYFLKQLRDQIMESLISDSLRKIEFYILQGDKLTNSGIFLSTKNNETLVVEVFSRAQKSMQKAIFATTAFTEKGKVLPGYIKERLVQSLMKHNEVLSELAGNTTGSQKDSYSGLLEAGKELEARAAGIQ
jgi:hypothetical protein